MDREERLALLDSFFRDLRYAIRNLRQSPVFSLTVCAVLALGIGGTSALFTVTDRVLLRPLPFEQSDRLVEVHESPGGRATIPVSYPNYLDWANDSRSFESLAFAAVVDQVLPGKESSRRELVAFVSGNFFETYRAKARLGRCFSAAEDRVNAPPVAVLDEGFWKDRFGGDPAVLGKPLSIEGRAFTVVGVLREFKHYRRAKIYVPVAHGLTSLFLSGRENHNSSAVTGRLRPGVTIEQARAELVTVSARLARAYPDSNRNNTVHVVSQHEWVAGQSSRAILMLLSAVAFLLLLVCVNVTGMMLVRASSRAKELAIRLAVGADARRIRQQLITESAVLGFSGAVLGLGVARLAIPFLVRLAPDSMAGDLLVPDWRVFAFSAIAAMVCSVLFGTLPAYRASRIDVNSTLKEGGRSSNNAASPRLRNSLVVLQVAIALVLMLGAGLFARSLNRLLSEDTGFQTTRLTAVRVSLPPGDGDLAHLMARYEAALESVSSLPGVHKVGSVNLMPLSPGNSNANIVPEGFELGKDERIPDADYRCASPNYFAAMGIPLVRGRIFSKSDGIVPNITLQSVLKWFRTANLPVVINQAMAERFWPGRDPIGRRFRFGPPSLQGPWMNVIGIVGNSRHRSLDRAPQPMFFVSSYLMPMQDQTFVIRASMQASEMERAIRRAVLAVDGSAVLSSPRSMDELIDEQAAGRRGNLHLLSAFAFMAFVLATLGIYGVLASTVAQRRQEYAIRLAMGATGGRLIGSVTAAGLRLVAAGIFLGVTCSYWLGQTISAFLYGVEPTDTLTYTLVCALLGAAGLAAAAIPAARAVRVNPVETLRAG